MDDTRKELEELADDLFRPLNALRLAKAFADTDDQMGDISDELGMAIQHVERAIGYAKYGEGNA